MNHAHIVSELSKALTRIGEVLPRVQLDGALYDTPGIRGSISRLCAYILVFLQQATQWYSAGWARRAIYSISRPLSFQETLEEIKICTKGVEAIASASARAEIGGLTTVLEGQAGQLKQCDQKLNDMQSGMNELQASSQRTETIFR